jgi:tetratricopeptide (TPR) repeat protein
VNQALGTTSDPAEIRRLKYTLAISYIDQGNIDEGIKELEDIYQLDKEVDDASRIANDLIFLGALLRETGDYQEAGIKYQLLRDLIEDAELSSERKENYRGILLYCHAKLALAQKNVKQAKQYTQKYKQSIKDLKDQIRTWNYHELLGLIAMEEGRYDEALGELRRSNIRNPNITFQMAISAYKKGDRSAAIKFCEKTVHFNGINNLNYVMIRMKATQFLDKLKS